MLIAVAVIVFIVVRRSNRDKQRARDFVGAVKQSEQTRKRTLMDVFINVHEMDEEMASKTAQAMLTCEKNIYNRMLMIFLGKDKENIGQLQKDVEGMGNSYRKLVDSMQGAKIVERGENPKQLAQMRANIKSLEKERDKLQADLDEAMVSMESMLKEYTQMYSGGGAKKEGLKHIENELSQLKDKITHNVIEHDKNERDSDEPMSDDDTGDVPELKPGTSG